MFDGFEDTVTSYSKELRERAIARMLPPANASISAVSPELNIPYPTLYAWRTQTGKQPAPVPPVVESDDQFDSQSKFQVVLETATVSEVDQAKCIISNYGYKTVE